ncbi:hypothetical protein QJU23_07695 [Pasteurella atlantica]|uniref:Uncharacterized protein n=2 Tax=Pasteurellaceae TaxID=712 RepID=A0ACC6HNA4_9PAST|nr:hypothetical protein [Pasteurella atlantica]MDP8052303.1 hypothetical protein [Pasteurella atlantica]MDP8101758.1 hypothetical protein [Pasteurella atlantica]MDP8105787.1 hypothetical protein [Pasteurella atlantica]MDP8149148.1 hypothetical protein [Pasteurella atlantica]
MKYIIMADGNGTRWNNSLGIPKHLIKINDEVILHRAVRLIKKFDASAEIIITSHDERYEVEGATRYEPKNNVLELDRFTEELIEDNICFIYGDTYYEDSDMKSIVEHCFNEDIMFYGNKKSIVAIKINNSQIFQQHINNVRELFLSKDISKCIGWQVYASYVNGDFENKEIKYNFVTLDDKTTDFNSYEDYVANTGITND